MERTENLHLVIRFCYPQSAILSSAPAVIRTPNQQIMRRFEGHQQGETKPDNPVFTESAAVKVNYIWSRLSTPSRPNRAVLAYLIHVNSSADITAEIFCTSTEIIIS